MVADLTCQALAPAPAPEPKVVLRGAEAPDSSPTGCPGRWRRRREHLLAAGAPFPSDLSHCASAD
jgi:hypothetical protein